jgi:hypothetical protein
MRIMLAPSAYYPHVGGIEELTRQLALTLESRGHDVSVLTNRWPAGVARHEVLGGVDVTRLAFPCRPRGHATRRGFSSPLPAQHLLYCDIYAVESRTSSTSSAPDRSPSTSARSRRCSTRGWCSRRRESSPSTRTTCSSGLRPCEPACAASCDVRTRSRHVRPTCSSR